MKHLKTILGVMVLMLAFSCTKNQAEGNGQVSFSLSSKLELADVTKSSVSQFTTLPNAQNFTITIKNASDATVFTGLISEWDEATLLPVGAYTVTATYGSLEEEGFDKPFFTGSANFTVQGAQTTEVKIQVSLGNTVILVNCTDNFKNYYEDYTFNLVRDGQTIVTFAKGETKAAFIDGYKVSIEGSVKSATNTKAFSKDYTNLNEATAYTVVFDVKKVGGASITVTFNNEVVEVPLGDVELND
jgi:hypothetical protein